MTALKKTLDDHVKSYLAAAPQGNAALRRFFYYDTSLLGSDFDSKISSIIDETALYFRVSYTSISVTGSGQTGYSYYSQRDFIKGQSDLDLAIIDPLFFSKMVSEVIKETDTYHDFTNFKDQESANLFQKGISLGIFNTYLLPRGNTKYYIFNFFDSIRKRHKAYFSHISAFIYLNETCFELRQQDLIEKIKRSK